MTSLRAKRSNVERWASLRSTRPPSLRSIHRAELARILPLLRLQDGLNKRKRNAGGSTRKVFACCGFRPDSSPPRSLYHRSQRLRPRPRSRRQRTANTTSRATGTAMASCLAIARPRFSSASARSIITRFTGRSITAPPGRAFTTTAGTAAASAPAIRRHRSDRSGIAGDSEC